IALPAGWDNSPDIACDSEGLPVVTIWHEFAVREIEHHLAAARFGGLFEHQSEIVAILAERRGLDRGAETAQNLRLLPGIGVGKEANVGHISTGDGEELPAWMHRERSTVQQWFAQRYSADRAATAGGDDE